jgi:V/A-type H+/Na+-transporting ATPase subunit C
MMLSRFDLHNVVAVLRAQSGEKREGADALVRVGWMTGSLAREVLRQDELAASVDLLARSTPDRGQGAALRAAFAEYERTEDLAALERAVVADHAARLSADLASAGSAARTLMRVGQREIDERNLLVALRLRDAVASGAEADTPPAATRLPGGSIPLAAFRDALNAPTSAAVVAQLGRVDRGRWRTPLERWAASGNLSALERELERRRIAEAVALFVAGDPLAIDVPIAFMAAKGSEARNLRLLGEAAVRDIDPEIIRRELLWTKAHA